MNSKKRLRATQELLVSIGWDEVDAKSSAQESVNEGIPLLETLCFHTLAQHILATIHTSSWIKNRAKEADGEEAIVIKRLLDSGASPKDLALFARIMQREYLSNLGCLLDGSGIFGTPVLPFEDFRVFSVDDSGKPQAEINDLHESLSFSDLATEMKLSREAARTRS